MLPSVIAGGAGAAAVSLAVEDVSEDSFLAQETTTSARAARAKNVVERMKRKRRNMDPPK
jgi:hypothetical protein